MYLDKSVRKSEYIINEAKDIVTLCTMECVTHLRVATSLKLLFTHPFFLRSLHRKVKGDEENMTEILKIRKKDKFPRLVTAENNTTRQVSRQPPSVFNI